MTMKPNWRGLFEPLESRILLSVNHPSISDTPLSNDVLTPPPLTAGPAGGPEHLLALTSFRASDFSAAFGAGSAPSAPLATTTGGPVAMPRTVDGSTTAPAVTDIGTETGGTQLVARATSTLDAAPDVQQPLTDAPRPSTGGVAAIGLVTDIKSPRIVDSDYQIDRRFYGDVVKIVPDHTFPQLGQRPLDAVRALPRRLADVAQRVSTRLQDAVRSHAFTPRHMRPDAAGLPRPVEQAPTPHAMPVTIADRVPDSPVAPALWWMADAPSEGQWLAFEAWTDVSVYDEALAPPQSVPAQEIVAAADAAGSAWSFHGSSSGVQTADVGVDADQWIALESEGVIEAAEEAGAQEVPEEATTMQTAGALMTVTFGSPLTRLIGAVSQRDTTHADTPLALAPIPPTPAGRRRRVARRRKRALLVGSGDEAGETIEWTGDTPPANEDRDRETVADDARDRTRHSAITPKTADLAFRLLGEETIGSVPRRQVYQRAGRSDAEAASAVGSSWHWGIGSLVGSIGWLAIERLRNDQPSPRAGLRSRRLVCAGSTRGGAPHSDRSPG